MTHKTIQKTCIYGAGAIGGWLGAGLAAAGCDVSMVARGTTLAALQQHGLRVQSAADTRSLPVQARADPLPHLLGGPLGVGGPHQRGDARRD